MSSLMEQNPEECRLSGVELTVVGPNPETAVVRKPDITFGRFRPQQSIWQFGKTDIIASVSELLGGLFEPVDFASLHSCDRHVPRKNFLGDPPLPSPLATETHKRYFSMFLVSSQMYMLNTITLVFLEPQIVTGQAKIALEWKRRLWVLNLVSIFSAVFMYWRHEMFCETAVYSFFAIFEFMAIYSNILFHSTSYFDFFDTKLFISFQDTQDEPVYKDCPTVMWVKAKRAMGHGGKQDGTNQVSSKQEGKAA
ncbi:unnamed protein product [Cyprideis torosa]|uniref:CWH43-like N-terminal domain-containing protein n=1 Tax=Cyprideis torosa TaxID=163714 RepID=A0A7R8W523_9CRUS|nr:unnamed protein product [Cyprideis torosa]CAG0880445.1 unnamed protein product [Cyprideis torosa]